MAKQKATSDWAQAINMASAQPVVNRLTARL